jgi:hypothetical protein
LALVVAVEAHPPGAGAIAVTLVATAIAVALAKLYSEIVGTQSRTRARVERQQISEMFDEVGAVAIGIAFPCVFFSSPLLGRSISTRRSRSPSGQGSV